MALSKNEIKFLKSLQIKKFREENKLFIVEGEKVIDELFNQSKYQIQCVYYTPAYHEENIPTDIESLEITEFELEKISSFKSPNKVLACVHFNDLEIALDKANHILILDEINDPGNLGTIIRTCDWFGIENIFISQNTVDPYNSKTLQSSMGSFFNVTINRFETNKLFESLNANGFEILGADLEGENLHQYNFSKKTALLMGSESHGISDACKKHIHKYITIPKIGKSESLNVAIATGIILSEISR